MVRSRDRRALRQAKALTGSHMLMVSPTSGRYYGTEYIMDSIDDALARIISPVQMTVPGAPSAGKQVDTDEEAGVPRHSAHRHTGQLQVGGEGRDTGVGSSGQPSPLRDLHLATDYTDDMESSEGEEGVTGKGPVYCDVDSDTAMALNDSYRRIMKTKNGYAPSSHTFADIASIQTEDFEEKYKTFLPQYRDLPVTPVKKAEKKRVGKDSDRDSIRTEDIEKEYRKFLIPAAAAASAMEGQAVPKKVAGVRPLASTSGVPRSGSLGRSKGSSRRLASDVESIQTEDFEPQFRHLKVKQLASVPITSFDHLMVDSDLDTVNSVSVRQKLQPQICELLAESVASEEEEEEEDETAAEEEEEEDGDSTTERMQHVIDSKVHEIMARNNTGLFLGGGPVGGISQTPLMTTHKLSDYPTGEARVDDFDLDSEMLGRKSLLDDVMRQDEDRSEGRLSSSSDVEERSRRNSDESSVGGRQACTSATEAAQRARELIVPNSEAESSFATHVQRTRQSTVDSGEVDSSSSSCRRGVAQQRSCQTIDWQESTLDMTSSPSTSSTAHDTPPGGARDRFAEAWRRGVESTQGDCDLQPDRRSAGSGSSSAKDAGSGSDAGMTREDSVVSSASSHAASHLSDVIQLMASQSHAENLLLNLGFNDTSSFLPRRFVNNWFEKVSHAHQLLSSRRDEHSSEEGSASGRSSPVTAGLESLNRVALLHRDADVTAGSHRRLAHSSTVTGPLRRPEGGHKAALMSEQDLLVSLQHVINRQSILLQAVEPKDGRRQGFTGKRQQSLPANLDALDDDSDMKALHQYQPEVKVKANRTQEFFNREQQSSVTVPVPCDKAADASTKAAEAKNKSLDTSDVSTTSSGPVALSTPHSGSSRTSADIESDLEKVGSDSSSSVTKSNPKTPPNGLSRAVQMRRNGTIPTIIVNCVSLDQQSLSSIEIAEILAAPPDDSGAWQEHVTDDRETQDDRGSLGVVTTSDSNEALLAPFLISSSASPATVSPVTVIEVDKLDNCHDSMDSEVNDPVPQSSDASNDYSVHMPINLPMTSSRGPFLLCRPPSSTVDLYDEDDYLKPVCRHVISSRMPPEEDSSRQQNLCCHDNSCSSSSGRHTGHACCAADSSSGSNNRSNGGHPSCVSDDSSSRPSHSSDSSSREAGVQQADGTLSPIRRIVTARAHTIRALDVGVQCSTPCTSVASQVVVETVSSSTQTAASSASVGQPPHPHPTAAAGAMVTRCNDAHCSIHRVLTRCIEEMLEDVVRAIGRTAAQQALLSQQHPRHGAFTQDGDRRGAVHASQSSHNHASQFSAPHSDLKDNRSGRDTSANPRKTRSVLARSVSFDSSLQHAAEERHRKADARSGSRSGRSEADRRKYTAIDDDDNEDDDIGFHRRHHAHLSTNRKTAALTSYNSALNGCGLETIVSVESEQSSLTDGDVKHNTRRMPRQMTAASSLVSINSDWSVPVTQSRRSSATTVSDTMRKQKSLASFDDDTCSNLDSHWTNVTSSESKTSRSVESGQSARKDVGHPVGEGHAGAFPVRAWSSVAGGERHVTGSTDRQKRSFDSVQTQPVKLRAKVKARNTSPLQQKARAVSDLRKLRPADALNRAKARMNEAMLEQKMREDAEEMSENESDDYCYYSNRTNDSALSSGGHRSMTSQTDDNIMSDNTRRPSVTSQHGGRLIDRKDHALLYKSDLFHTDYTLQGRGQRRSRRELQVPLPVHHHHSNHGVSPAHYGLSPSVKKKATRAGYYTDPPLSYRRQLPNPPSRSDAQHSVRQRRNSHTVTSRAHLPSLSPDRHTRQQLLMERDLLLAEIDNVLKYGLQPTHTATRYHHGNGRLLPEDPSIRLRNSAYTPPSYEGRLRRSSYDSRRPSKHHQGYQGYTSDGRIHEMKDKHAKNQHRADDNFATLNNAANASGNRPTGATGATGADDGRQSKAKYKRQQFWQQVTADRMSASARDADAAVRPRQFATQQSLGAFSTLNRQESADYKQLVKGKGSVGDYSNLIIQEETDDHGDYDNVPTFALDDDSYCNNSHVASPSRDAVELTKSKDSNVSADSGEDYLPLTSSTVPRPAEAGSTGTPVKKRHLYSTYHSEDTGDIRALSSELAADDLAEAILAQTAAKSTDPVSSAHHSHVDTRLTRSESKTKRLQSMHSQSIVEQVPLHSTEHASSDDETEKYLTVLSKSSTFSESSVDSNYLQVLAESEAEGGCRNVSHNPPGNSSAFHEPVTSKRPDHDYDNCMQVLQEYKREKSHALTIPNVAAVTKSKVSPDNKRQFLDIARPNNDSTSSEDSMQNYLRLVPNSEEDDLNEKRHKIFDVQSSKVFNSARSKPTAELSIETLTARSASEESAEDYLQIVEHMIGERGHVDQVTGEQPGTIDDTDNTNETVAQAQQRLSDVIIVGDTGRGKDNSEDSDDSAPDYLQVLRDSDGDSTDSRRYGVRVKVNQGYPYASAVAPNRSYLLTVKRDSQESVTSDDSTQDYLQVVPNSDDEQRARHYFLARHIADSRQDTGNDDRPSTEDAESSDTHSISEAEYRLQGNYSDEECRSRHNSSADQDRRPASSSTRHGSLCGVGTKRGSLSGATRPPKDRLNNLRQPSRLPRPLTFTSLPAASKSNISQLIGYQGTNQTDVSSQHD